jgi:phosphatidylglycerophosphatase A
MRQREITQLNSRLRAALCTGLWFGYSPVIPGTVGTLPAVGVFVIISLVFSPFAQLLLTAFFFALSCILSIALGAWAEQYWKTKDPRQFVLDEIASFFLTVMLFSVPSLVHTVFWAFVMTRLFDIIKPPPARTMESLPGGWGILMDDLVASVYAALVLHAAKHFLPSLFGL